MKRIACIVLAWALAPAAALGQGADSTAASAAPAPPPPPTTPSPAHEPLAFFEGTWTIAEMPVEMGFVETCAWMPHARRHMVCRSRYETETGPREGMSVFSFREDDATYRYHGFRPRGSVEVLTGRVEGNVWTFEGETGEGAARRSVRVTVEPLDANQFRFVEEVAQCDGEPTREEIHYLRASAEPDSPDD